MALPGVLRVPAFRDVWFGSLASNAGTWLQIVASGFLVYELTGSAAAVGGLALVARAPAIVLSAAAGQLADRRDRRLVCLVTFGLQGLAAAALAVAAGLGWATVPVIYALTFVLWAGFAVGLPAMLALIPLLVPRPLFSQAVSVNAAGINVARLIGPAIGGLTLATLGPAWCFALNAASFAALVWALARLGPMRPSGSGGRASFRDGLRVAASDRALRRLLLGMAVFTALASPIQELAPVIAGEALDGGELVLGALLSAMGAGGLLGAWLLERATGHGLRRHVALPLATTVFAVGMLVLALSTWTPLSLAAMAFAGAFWIWLFAGTNTAIQLRSPEGFVGRMLGYYQLAVLGGVAVGSFAAGYYADLVGIGPALATYALILGAFGVWSLLNPVREIDEHDARWAAAGHPGSGAAAHANVAPRPADPPG